VKAVDEWKFSSLYRRMHGSTQQKKLLHTKGMSLPRDYMSFVQTPLTQEEIDATRNAVNKSVPYGKDNWRDAMVDRFKLQATIRGKGRPKKSS
jgi:putative transposase